LAFSDEEKEQIRYHLGYLNQTAASSLAFGQPVPLQTLFILDSAMDRVLNTAAEDRIRQMIATLDKIECTMVEAIDRLAAKTLDGGITLNEKEIDKLEFEYYRWAGRIASQMGVPLYPYATKFQLARGMMAGTIPVTNG
jgi:hypothetical protein